MRYTYVAPAGTGDGKERVTMRHASSAVEFALKLVAQAPERLDVSVAPRVVEADGQSKARLVVRLLDAHASPAAGHTVAVVVGDESQEAEESAAGVYELTLAPRTTVGTLPIDIVVKPRTLTCLRPRVVRDGDAARVVDGRGVACTGAARWVDASGAVVGTGVGAWSEARAALGGGARLEIEGALPRVATLAEAGALAEVLRSGIAVPYVVPAPVKLRLLRASGTTVRLEVEGMSEAVGRVEVMVGGAPASVTAISGQTLEISVGAAARPVDVVARDKVTGTSAWLRLP